MGNTTGSSERIDPGEISANRANTRLEETDPGPREPPKKHGKRPSRKKARIAGARIASLNMKGHGAHNTHTNEGKWYHINQIMRSKKIALLAVQETHMNEERRSEIEDLFKNRLRIGASWDKDAPTRVGGVAIVINKDILDASKVTYEELTAGQALLAQVYLQQGTRINVLAVYAPCSLAKENADFWTELKIKTDALPTSKKPDVMLGDFNMCEDEIDRLPVRGELGRQVQTFDELKSSLNLIDGWRDTYTDAMYYTFHKVNTSIHARLDRIYLTKDLLHPAEEWAIHPSGIATTDHDMVSVVISDDSAPEMGKGRWTFPEFLIEDKIFMEHARRIGLNTMKKMNEQRGANSPSPQIIWKMFKTILFKKAQDREKQLVPELMRKERRLEKEIEEVSSNDLMSKDRKADELAKKKQDLRETTARIHMKARHQLSTKLRAETEVMTRSFALQGKEKKPRDVICSLKSPRTGPNGEPKYVRLSEGMAELAKEYHKKLQEHKEEDEHQKTAREAAIMKSLGMIDAPEIPEEITEALKAPISVNEMSYALRSSKNATSPGLDGAIYELWKAIEKNYERDSELEETTPFSAMQLLTIALLDMEGNGVDPQGAFAEGWMCPLYKKKR
jgi:exonuclease III